MIIIKNSQEIQSMQRGGHILAQIMNEIRRAIAPGKNTEDLDKLAEKLVFSNGGKPAFKGQGGKSNPYPATICASINSEIVHGLPSSKKIIKVGDIVKIDIGFEFEGMITDMARTFEVGAVSPQAHKLVRATREALEAGINKIKAGNKLSDYSSAVDSVARSFRFFTIKELVGHGVGKILHEDPQIPNYKTRDKEIILQPGMTLALEPMINEGNPDIELGEDNWTYLTTDGKLSAHFEDTVVVTEKGCEILTRI